MNVGEHNERCREYLEALLRTAEDAGDEYLALYITKDEFEEICRFMLYGKFAPSFTDDVVGANSTARNLLKYSGIWRAE